MGIGISATRNRAKAVLAALLAAMALMTLIISPALARQPLAVILVDARTGKVLYAKDADARRYPASITKVMTIYLLLRELKAGRISLNTRLKVSRRASLKPPSKLWLKPGQTITVDQAIRALAVKSANDVAAVVAENLAGSEAAFARRMTAMARALGMTRTTFRNASGLPNPPNVSTARDLATLSLRLMRDFPGYYRKYFGLRRFTWRGRRHRNHNRLLGRVRGMDGIKTGYTRAAGSNLAASVRRGGKRVVAVVLGAPSSRWRNAYMARLLNGAFRRYRLASGTGIAALAGRPPGYSVATARAWAAKAARMSGVARVRAVKEKGRPSSRRKPMVRSAEVRMPTAREARKLAMLAEMAAATPAPNEAVKKGTEDNATAVVRPRPRPEGLARRKPDATREEGVLVLKRQATGTPGAEPTKRIATGRAGKAIPALSAAVAVRVPGTHDAGGGKAGKGGRDAAGVPADVVIGERPLPDAPPVRAALRDDAADAGVVIISKKPRAAAAASNAGGSTEAAVAVRVDVSTPRPPGETSPAAREDGGGIEIIAGRPDHARALMAARWLIQIGAFPTLEGAKTYLARARRATRHVHGRYPVVIRVKKGDAAFYRARYAGFSRKQAVRACRELKRKGISCLPMAPGAG